MRPLDFRAYHVDGKDWAKSLNVNATATQNLIGLLEPLLRARTASRSSPMIRAGQKFFGAYGASKAAQMALVDSWRAESERLGPRVLTPEPSPMPTAIRGRFFPGEESRRPRPLRGRGREDPGCGRTRNSTPEPIEIIREWAVA